MKTSRFFGVFLALVILFGTFTFSVTAGENIVVMLNGTELSFDVQPQIINDRTMVPMRVIFEALGADVYWIEFPNDFQMILAVKNEIKVFMMIDEEEFYKFVGSDISDFLDLSDEMQPISLDVPVQLVDGRTLVPLRAVSEALEIDVYWDELTNTVTLNCDVEFITTKNTDETFYAELLEYMEGEYDYDFNERIYVNVDNTADMMVISSEERENPQKCFVITDEKEIKDLLTSYDWHDRHLPCCWNGWEPDYTIRFFYGDFVKETLYFRDDWTGTPYNAELGIKLREYISDFKNIGNFSYRYTMAAPLTANYESLKTDLHDMENFYVFSNSLTPKYSSFVLEYTDRKSDYEHINFRSTKYEYELGDFEPDNIFFTIVESLKEDSLYVTNSNTRSVVSGGGLFTRRMSVYVNKVLDEETIEKYRTKWSAATKYEPHFMANNEFGYYVPDTYEFTIISDRKLDERDIESLNKKYNILLVGENEDE